MDIEQLREFCLKMPGVTEDIKWENNLVFSVAGKIFCLADLEFPLRITFKVTEEQFNALTGLADIIQAPYFARKKWVCVLQPDILDRPAWEFYLTNSYSLVVMKLPKKTRDSLSTG